MTLTSSRAFEIVQGTSTPEEDTLYLLGTGTTGTPGALRVLTHPDSENWPPIPYQRNPDEWSNMASDAILVPMSNTVLTQESTVVHRYARTLEDVIITERWFGGPAKAAMEAYFLYLLLEYWLNPPAVNPVSQTYITWEPRDINDYVYNIEIVDVLSGGTPGAVWIKELIPNHGDIGGGMQTSDVPTGGLLLKPVDLVLKLVSKVA